MIGAFLGVLATLAFVTAIQISKPTSAKKILAAVGDNVLREGELRKKLASELIPLKNDEKGVLERGVKDWLDARLLEKEAKREGISVEELYRKEIWSQVSEYARAEGAYLEKLRQRYHAQIFLRKAGPKPAAPLEAAPSRGPEGAPVTLVEFSDFHCPFCKDLTPVLETLFKNYSGKIRWIFHHYPLPMHPGSDRTHEASACAQEQGKFWEFHDALFGLPEAPKEADLKTLAGKLGLDLVKFQECTQGRRYQKLVREDIEEGNQKGVQGTPTVFINDQVIGGAYPYEYFVQVVEGILNPKKVPSPPPGPASLPREPSPAVPVQFDDLDGKPSLGPKEAPVTLVEFSDFECPFCKRVTPTLGQLMKNYPGKIRRIWRHYPLSFHRGSDRAHEASECAREQNKFWEYHDKLFETQGSPREDAPLAGLAGSLGLNKKKFEKCLKSGKYQALIQKEISKGNQAGVQGTPAVFINGELISGAQPYENFDRIVKQELAKS